MKTTPLFPPGYLQALATDCFGLDRAPSDPRAAPAQLVEAGFSLAFFGGALAAHILWYGGKALLDRIRRRVSPPEPLPGMLKLASPFILVGSAVLDIVFSLKIRKTPCGRWLFASLLTEIFRIVGLSLIIDFTSVGIKNLIFYACISFGLNLIFGMDINFASAESGSSSTANAREKADLLKSIRAAENAVAGKKAALNKHNRGDLGYGYVDNKTMMNSIRGIEKNLEIDKKKLEKLS